MSDDEVYQQCAADAVEHMLGGKVASLFMFLWSKKSPTGPTEQTPKPGYLINSSSNFLRGPLVRVPFNF